MAFFYSVSGYSSLVYIDHIEKWSYPGTVKVLASTSVVEFVQELFSL